MVVVKDYSQVMPFRHEDGARLSEGVTYDIRNDRLLWVDIYNSEIHAIDNVSRDGREGRHMTIKIEGSQGRDSVGVVFLTDDPGIVLFGGKDGIGQWKVGSHEWEYVVKYSACSELAENPDRLQRLRPNDGNTTRDGKYILIGLMNDFNYDVKAIDGCILRISVSKGTVEMVWDGIAIANAVHWDHDEKYVFITDSLQHTIWRCPWDKQTNSLNRNGKEAWIDFKSHNKEFASPEPDGSDMDIANNLLYVTVWSTHRVQVYDITQRNKLVQEIILPVTTPRGSCCCLAGSDLYVTTANDEISDEPVQKGQGGSLFRLLCVADNKATSSKAYLNLH
ncbi:similar to Saccharomyces cerevisiae YBR053C Putative protein of unknown function [Maudiozyma barnettii]|uniref:SMP-30/Gluconolactonase/LRE-like region domain-containing protein n=1 Tax=Maudiozyma barnettii TaxID=61262 RepID=A0A8H2VHD2_9SACH|nr:hypothetical protein [Kazachstania barnettii]CAB4255239.1 similar to Saccharomyces cerevisiae YBR053C Putative protein of unknown function [Kazachstania barnettii]CAD1783646.1 similar to Saccharomyces cerevisiae YBR053C Putative protein of unknown function [Kazachstania barnettii]